MSSKSHERTQERRIALQVLYQGEILDTSPLELIEKKLLVDEDALMDQKPLSLISGKQLLILQQQHATSTQLILF